MTATQILPTARPTVTANPMAAAMQAAYASATLPLGGLSTPMIPAGETAKARRKRLALLVLLSGGWAWPYLLLLAGRKTARTLGKRTPLGKFWFVAFPLAFLGWWPLAAIAVLAGIGKGSKAAVITAILGLTWLLAPLAFAVIEALTIGGVAEALW